MDYIAAIKDVQRATAEDGTSCMLARMALSVDRPYMHALQVLHKEFGWERFTSDRGAMLFAEVDKRVDQLFSAGTRGMLPETVLRRTIDDVGLSSAARTYIHVGLPDMLALSVRGVHFVVTHDLSAAQFGQTHDYYSLGIAFSKVNLHASDHSALRLVLHEYGHAFHFYTLKTIYPILRESMPRFFTEAIALVLESIADDGAWLTRFCGASAEDVRRLRQLRLVREIYRLRENLAFALMECILLRLSVPLEDAWSAIAGRFLYPGESPLLIRGFERYMSRLVFHDASGFNTAMTLMIAFSIRRHLLVEPGHTLYAATLGPRLEELTAGAGNWYDMLSAYLGFDFKSVDVGEHVSLLAKGVFP